jgi:predicted transcriptional regulator
VSVYVDQLRHYPTQAIKDRARRYGHLWCHLLADTTDELHALADRIALARRWFQEAPVPHYDLTPTKRRAAVAAGAIERETGYAFLRTLGEAQP